MSTPEGLELIKWSWQDMYDSMSPAEQRNSDRHARVIKLSFTIYRICPWLQWPLLGLVTHFWVGLVEEGPVQLLTPRYGALTFSYLNDGMRPTLWHTYQQVMHPRGKYDGIYTHGAPASRAEAEDIENGMDGRYPNFVGP